MNQYFYKAKLGTIEVKEGVIEADDQRNAVLKIIQMGYVPLDVFLKINSSPRPAVPAKTASFSLKRIRPSDKVVFLRQLHDFVDAEVPLLKALHIIIGQTKSPSLKEILRQVAVAVQDGVSLSQALSLYPDVFPFYMVTMIRAGEVSGNLKVILSRLSHFAQKEQETIGKIRASLVYPSLILAVGLITVFVLLTFVVPKLSLMFEDLGQKLPVMTQILLWGSHFLSRFWWIFLVAIGGAGIWLKKIRLRSYGKCRTDAILLKIPFWGKFIRNHNLERFSRTLGILLNSGVEMFTALECVQGVVDNEVIKVQIKKVAQEVTQGSALVTALGSKDFFPGDMVSMIGVGEEAGRLDLALLKSAESLEKESERMVKTATTLIEPILILFIGSIVGFMVIALLLPIFEMNFVSS